MDAFVTNLNSTGTTLVDFAVGMLIQSSVLIVVLLGLDLLLRKHVRAVFRYCILLLVLVKLVLPTSLALPTGLGYWLGDKVPDVAIHTTALPARTGTTAAITEPTLAPSVIDSTFGNELPPMPMAAPVAVEQAPPGVGMTWQGLVLLIWLGGVVAMALLLIQRVFFVRGLIAQAQPGNGRLVDLLRQCCAQMKMSGRVDIKLTTSVGSPSVCGLTRPVILIPAELLAKLDRAELKAVLLHELAHVKRGDLWISLVQTVLQIAYFFHPLLWLANVAIRRVREQAVDEMVLATMGEQAPEYPCALLNVSRLTFGRAALSLRLIGVVESKSAVTSRIRRMLDRPFPTKAKLGIAGLIAVFIMAAVLLPMAKGKADPTQEVNEAEGEQPMIVRGTVTDREGKPISNSHVSLFCKSLSWGLNDRIVQQTQTNEDGSFRFANPVQFDRSVYNSKYVSYVILATHPEHAFGWHEIKRGKERNTYEIVLTEPASQEITVTDHDDNPLKGVWVWPYNVGNPSEADALFRKTLLLRSDPGLVGALTDKNGKAIITNLPKTRCSFHTTFAGYASGLAWSGGGRIRISKGANVSGSVVTQDDQPVIGAVVRFHTDWGMWQSFLAQTDEQGNFHLEDLPGKGWDMSPWGYAPASGTYVVTAKHKGSSASERKITVEPGQSIEDYKIMATGGTLVRVKVLEPETEKPIQGARIQGNSESGRLDSYTDQNGLVEWRVQPGSTSIWFLSPPQGYWVSANEGGQRPDDSMARFDAQGDLEKVTIYAPSKLNPMVTLRGQVILPDGSSAGGIKISTSNSSRYSGAGWGGRGGAYTGTNLDGTFELKNVPAGAGMQLFLYAHTGDYKHLLAKVITPSETGYNLTEPLIMQKGETAEVMFTDEKGDPRSNMNLKLQPMMWNHIIPRSDSRPVQTGSDGMVKIDGIVRGMKYFVCDAQTDRSRRGWNDKYYHQKALLISDATQEPVTVVLSHNMIIHITDSKGNAVPIKSIERLYVFLPDGKWSMGGIIDIEETLTDGSVLIHKKHLSLGKPGNRVEITITESNGASVTATGKFPDDASNRVILHISEKTGTENGHDPKPTEAIAGNNASDYKAVLPNGVTVELIGVCEHFSDGKQWWRPDGSLLEVRPYLHLGGSMSSATEQILEVAFKTNAPDDEIGFTINEMESGGLSHPYNDNPVEDIWAGWVRFDKDAQKGSFVLGIAIGPWTTIARSPADGSSGQSSSKGDFTWGQSYQEKESAVIPVTHNIRKQQQDYRVVAIDTNGNTHTSWGLFYSGSNDWTVTTLKFQNLTVEKIKEFQFQTRPYEWITFKNVSLRPGHKTNVQIEVAGGQAGELPRRSSVESAGDISRAPAMIDVLKGIYGTLLAALERDDVNSAMAVLETLLQVDEFEKNVKGSNVETPIKLAIEQLRVAYSLLKDGQTEQAKAIFQSLSSAGPGFETMVRNAAKAERAQEAVAEEAAEDIGHADRPRNPLGHARAYLRALQRKDHAAAAKLCKPNSKEAGTSIKFVEVFDFSKVVIEQAYQAARQGMAVTSSFGTPDGKTAQMGITMEPVAGGWQIRDFDNLPEGKAESFIAAFKQAYPDAHPIENVSLKPNSRTDVQAMAEEQHGASRIHITDSKGNIVPIKRIKRLYVLIPDGKWSMGGTIAIKGRLPDGSVLIDKKHLTLAKPGYKTEITIVTDNNEPVLATGKFPDDPSSRLTFVAQAPFSVDAVTYAPLANIAPDEVAGRVVNPAGNPITGAKITIYPQSPIDPNRNRPIVTTDDNGVFRIPGFGHSWYTYVQVEAPRFAAFAITDLPIGKGFIVTLDNKTRLKGSFLSPDGTPAGTTTITLVHNKPTARDRMRTVSGIRMEHSTDETGAYDFPIEPGAYDIQIVSKYGYFARHQKMHIPKGVVTTLPSNLQPGLRFEPKLIDSLSGKPVVGEHLHILDRSQPGFISAKDNSERTSNPQGAVLWQSLMPGQTSFAFDSTDSLYQRRWSKQSRRHRMTPDRPQRRVGIDGLTFDLQEEMEPVTIIMEKGVTIIGHITDPNGGPLSGISADLAPTGNNSTFTGDARYARRTDQNGRYELHLPAGNGIVYNIIAHDPQKRWANAASKPFSSKPGDSFTFDLQMTSGGQITGRVVDADGQGISDFEVEAVPKDTLGNPYYHPRTLTDAQGRFVLGPMRTGKFSIYPDPVANVNTGQIPNQYKRVVTITDNTSTDIGDLPFWQTRSK